MKIERIYFSWLNLSNIKNSDKVISTLKCLTIYVGIIFSAFIILYSITSLYNRLSKKSSVSTLDKAVSQHWTKLFFGELYALKKPKVILATDSEQTSKVELSEVLSTYNHFYAPHANKKNLEAYSQSEEFQRHAKTARIYYNGKQLSETDALRVVFQREPTNIAMQANGYNKKNLNKLFGYEQGIYNDKGAKKEDQSLFSELPNTATVYSETYLWSSPGQPDKKEIACLSVPAPALDSAKQPNYKYYMQSGSLNRKRYEQEMSFLFRCIEKAIRNNKDSAFDGKGIKRVVLCRFGQNSFLKALSPEDKEAAHRIYRQQMAALIDNVKDVDVEVVLYEYLKPKKSDIWHDKMIIGDLLQLAKEGDLIINAWDPHSAPGNGNDNDGSFDGMMGKGTGILLTQTSWLNETLRSKHSLIPVF